MKRKFLTLGDAGRVEVLDENPVNFSIRRVAPSEEIEVSLDEQMLLSGALVVEGQLTNFGQVVLIDLEDKDTEAPPFPELPPDNFSHVNIQSGQTKTVPSGQQMNCFGMIKNFGQLVVQGELTLTQVYQEDPLEPPVVLPGDNFSVKRTLSAQTKTVPANQQMLLVGSLENDGMFQNFGQVVLLNAGEDQNKDYLPPYLIEEDELYEIKRNRLLFVPFMFQNFGHLINNGRVYIGV